MSNKKDLEHELFFGLVFSLTLLIITYPEISELSDLFANFVDKTEAIYVSQLVKIITIISLILSSVCRYYGAVKNNIRYVMLSLFFFLLSFHISINLILYKVFWIWLSNIHFIFTTALPILLLVINIFVINDAPAESGYSLPVKVVPTDSNERVSAIEPKEILKEGSPVSQSFTVMS